MRAILESLGVAEDVPVFEIWNKIDLLPEDTRAALLVQDARRPDIHAVSALTGEGLAPLLDAIEERLGSERFPAELALPFSDGRRRAWLYENGVVTGEEDTQEGHRLRLLWTARQKAAFEAL